MNIHSFLDKDTETFTHVLVDEASKHCAIIAPVLDFDPAAGKISYDNAKLYLCHDYPPKGEREHIATVCVGEQKLRNIHVIHGTPKAEFVRMRNQRDKTLAMPRLILPSVQVNINAGELPKPEDNGVRYLKIPLNQLS